MTNVPRNLSKLNYLNAPLLRLEKNQYDYIFKKHFHCPFHFFTKSHKLQEKRNFVTGPRICLYSTRCGRHHVHNLQMTRMKKRTISTNKVLFKTTLLQCCSGGTLYHLSLPLHHVKSFNLKEFPLKSGISHR